MYYKLTLNEEFITKSKLLNQVPLNQNQNQVLTTESKAITNSIVNS